MKQKIGQKKLEKCRKIGQKNYFRGWVRGGWEHYTALCFYQPKDTCLENADLVNYKTGEWEPAIRDGAIVYQRI